MKKLPAIIILLALISLGVTHREQITEKYEKVAVFSFCEKPIGFHVGQVDEEFGISRETILADVIKASEIWNSAYPTPLFVYDENSNLDINLKFDERQRALNQVNQQEQTVELEKFQLSETLRQYQQDYEMLSRAINELNTQIEYWNNRGGAPETVYNELITQQQQLNEQADELNKTAEGVSQTSNTINSKVFQLNNTIESFNKMLDSLPEEGVYVPQQNKIEVYFYDTKPRFMHTVAHELGHALGLGHIAVEGAIMNPITSDNASLSEKDLQELTTFCEEQNKIDYLTRNLRLIWNNFLKSLN